MIYAFQKETFYYDDRLTDRYAFCVRAIQYMTHWHVWVVWYNFNDERIEENKRWYVDKKNLIHWHYGKHGPN